MTFIKAFPSEFFWLLRKTAELSDRKTQKKQNNFLSSQRKTLGPGPHLIDKLVKELVLFTARAA